MTELQALLNEVERLDSQLKSGASENRPSEVIFHYKRTAERLAALARQLDAQREDMILVHCAAFDSAREELQSHLSRSPDFDRTERVIKLIEQTISKIKTAQ